MLTNEQLPASVFTESHNNSSKYQQVRTIDVVNALREDGWGVAKALQIKNNNYGKHELRLRRNNVVAVGDSLPEIILRNSHDGTSSYTLTAGIYRLVCSNGLTVSESTLGMVKLRHTGDIRDMVVRSARDLGERLPQVFEEIAKWKEITLAGERQWQYLERAAEIRSPGKRISLPHLNRARRWDDRGTDLWTTFNRVQENMLRGCRGVRKVVSVESGFKLNQELWDMTHEFALGA